MSPDQAPVGALVLVLVEHIHSQLFDRSLGEHTAAEHWRLRDHALAALSFS